MMYYSVINGRDNSTHGYNRKDGLRRLTIVDGENVGSTNQIKAVRILNDLCKSGSESNFGVGSTFISIDTVVGSWEVNRARETLIETLFEWQGTIEL